MKLRKEWNEDRESGMAWCGSASLTVVGEIENSYELHILILKVYCTKHMIL